MKIITFLIALLPFMGMAQVSLPFQGEMKYKVSYESSVIPPAQIAQMPTSQIVKVSGNKIVSDNRNSKKIYNGDENTLYTLLNLSMMGMGKYVISTEGEALDKNEGLIDFTLEESNETKVIHGLTAKKASGSAVIPQGKISFIVYYVEDFGPSSLNKIESLFKDIKGFPLEYSIIMDQLTTSFEISSITSKEIEDKAFIIPKSYKSVTEEELEEEMSAIMGGME